MSIDEVLRKIDNEIQKKKKTEQLKKELQHSESRESELESNYYRTIEKYDTQNLNNLINGFIKELIAKGFILARIRRNIELTYKNSLIIGIEKVGSTYKISRIDEQKKILSLVIASMNHEPINRKEYIVEKGCDIEKLQSNIKTEEENIKMILEQIDNLYKKTRGFYCSCVETNKEQIQSCHEIIRKLFENE